VIDLGPGEGTKRLNLCDNRIRKPGSRPVPGGDGEGGLFVVVGEDDRSVLGAGIGTLTVESGRIVRGPEDLEDLVKGNCLRVKFELDDLGVPSSTRANFLVGRILGLTSGVARHDLLNTGQALENRFETPEATAAEDC